MLDVHVPQKSEHTWTDFAIHIATIVVGLFIAVGIEQTVELFHHRHQVADIRHQLEIEYRINLVDYRVEREDNRRFVPILERDLAILEDLRAHPGSPLTGEISWSSLKTGYEDSSWKSLQGSPVLALLPRKELERYTELYGRLDDLDADEDRAHEALQRATQYGIRGQTVADMTSAQLDQTIQAISDALSAYLHLTQDQLNLHRRFPEFTPVPTGEEIRSDFHMVTAGPSRKDQEDVARELQTSQEEIERIDAEDKHE